MPLVDLDDPVELRARWSALAAVAHATGFDRRWYADENGWYHQDETGSDLRMIRLDGERAVLFGFHTQHSRTAGADLLAGSPDWIGQPEVKQRIAAGQLGFVYGSFNGTWARAAYPGDPWQPLDDGFAPIAEWVTSDEEAAREMIEWAAEWADYLGGLDELLPIGLSVIRAAASSGLTADSLTGLFGQLGIGPRSPRQPDLGAALHAAAQFGDGAVAVGPVAQPMTEPVEAVVPFDEPEEEESFYVPPGVSPFTGQPIGPELDQIIGEPTPYQPEPESAPEFGGSDAYGVVEKKRRFGRKKKQDEDSLALLGLVGPEPAPEDPHYEEATPGPQYGDQPASVEAHQQSSPEQYLGDQRLPSAEPPRVGGPVEDGEDFYASLFADAPAAATYSPDVPTEAGRDWSSDDTGVTPIVEDEPAAVSASDETGVLQPVRADSAPSPESEAPERLAEAVDVARAADDEPTDDAPTAEIAAVADDAEPEDEYYPTNTSPFAPTTADAAPEAAESPFSSIDPADLQPGEHGYEIIGDADWTADQLAELWEEGAGEPAGPAPLAEASSGEEAAVEVTAQLEAIRDDETGAGTPPEADDGFDADQRFAPADVPESEQQAAGRSQPDHRLEAEQHEAEHEVEQQFHEVEQQQPGPQIEERQPSAEQGVAESDAPLDVQQPFAAQENLPVGVARAEGSGEGDSDELPSDHSPADRQELVAPPVSSGPVVVPGLGLVGTDGPRVEPVPGSIEEAMRSEFERPRPRPQESPALQALREWCRARTRIVPSGFTIQVQVLDPAHPSYRFDLEPPDVDDPQYAAERLSELLGELWVAESQGEQGGWLFARIDAAGRTVRIDRWYDQVPDWWDHPIEPRLDVHGLVRRLYGRGPDWQPSYLEKLYTTAR